MFVQKIKPAYSYLFGITACLIGHDHPCCDHVNGIVTQFRTSSISSLLGWLRLQNLFLFDGKNPGMLEFNSNHTLSVGQASLRAPFPLERLWETLHPSPLRDFAFDPKINCFQESAPCQILIISRWLSNIDHRLSMHRLSNIDQQWAGCRLLIIDLSCAYCQTSINLLTRGLG